MKETEATKRRDRPLFYLILTAFVSVLLMPKVAGDGMRAGLELVAHAVIPAVFPSLILTDLLLSCDLSVIEKTVGRVFARVFCVSERGAVAWITGLVAGFPIGVITVANDVRAGLLSKEEGEYLLTFVNNTGPAFLVGGIGLGLFGSVKLGWALYLLQIPVSIVVGILFRPQTQLNAVRTVSPTTPRASDPVAAVVRASENCVRIAGFVCFFSVAFALLSGFLPDGIPTALLSVLLEVGNGAKCAAGLSFPVPAVPLVSFAVCFSGLSVVCQSVAAVADTGMKTGPFLLGKIASGTLGLLISSLLCLTK